MNDVNMLNQTVRPGWSMGLGQTESSSWRPPESWCLETGLGRSKHCSTIPVIEVEGVVRVSPSETSIDVPKEVRDGGQTERQWQRGADRAVLRRNRWAGRAKARTVEVGLFGREVHPTAGQAGRGRAVEGHGRIVWIRVPRRRATGRVVHPMLHSHCVMGVVPLEHAGQHGSRAYWTAINVDDIFGKLARVIGKGHSCPERDARIWGV